MDQSTNQQVHGRPNRDDFKPFYDTSYEELLGIMENQRVQYELIYGKILSNGQSLQEKSNPSKKA